MPLFQRPQRGKAGPAGPPGQSTAGPAGKDGRDGRDAVSPDVRTIVKEVVKLIPKPKDGKRGPRGPMGMRGDRGPSGRALFQRGGGTSGLTEDEIAAMFVAGSNVTISYDPITKKITIAASGGGGGVTDHGDLTGLADDDHPQYHNDARADTWLATKDTGDIAEGANLYFTNERVDDRVAALLTEGAGIDLTHDDGANTLTIASTITQYTDELAQDAIGGILVDSDTIDFTYADGTPSITAIIKDDSITDAKIDDAADVMQAVLAVNIDGGGAVITTGIKIDVEIPFNCTIERVTMLADVSGSIVVDIWKDTYANFPPVVGDSITASAKPTISSALKSQDSTLTGWTKTITAGDTLRFNVDSVTSVKRLMLSIKLKKT